MKTQSTLTPEEQIKQLQAELAQTRNTLNATQSELAGANADLADAHAALDVMHAGEIDLHAMNVTVAKLNLALDAVAGLRSRLEGMLNGTELSPVERRRLNNTGVRRYGLTDKISDMMEINPDLVPQYVDQEHLKELLRLFEISRNIDALIKQCERMNGDIMLTLGDEAYHVALMFYGALRDASRRNVPGARALFNLLRTFFSRPKNMNEETQKKLIRDATALIHGKADGTLEIHNEQPHLEGGTHEVIDTVHKRTADGKWKETESGEIDED